MAKYGVNKVTLVGNLGQDPDLRYLDQGIAVCNFTLATTERFRNKEGIVTDRTEWHNIVMWRGLAETAGKYLKKGSTIYLEGRLTTRNWEDKEGKKHYKTEIEAGEMLFLDSKPQTGAGQSQSFARTNEPLQEPIIASPISPAGPENYQGGDSEKTENQPF